MVEGRKGTKDERTGRYVNCGARIWNCEMMVGEKKVN
jgi:hypothetical protein